MTSPWLKVIEALAAHIRVTAAAVCLLFAPNAATAGSTTHLEATGPQPLVMSPNGRAQVLYEESHALLISVSGYLGAAKMGWDKLDNTTSEVDAVSNALRPHGFSVTRVVDPTGEELVSAFRRFLAQHGQKRNIRLVVFFSGHGYTNPINEFGYVVPADAKNPRIDPVDFYSKALPIQQVELWAREVVAKHALFMFDSCFSGSIFSTKSEGTRPDAVEASARWRFLQGKAQEPVRQFISAGGANELLPGRSDFVPMLLHALHFGLPKQGDKFFTGKGLGLWLEESLPSLTGGKQNPQSGVVRSPALALGDMVFQVPLSNAPRPASDAAGPVSPVLKSETPVGAGTTPMPSQVERAKKIDANHAATRLRLISTHRFEWPEAKPGKAISRFSGDGSSFFVVPVLRWRGWEGDPPTEFVLEEGRTDETNPGSAMTSWRLSSKSASGGYFANDISDVRLSDDRSTFTVLDASWARVLKVRRSSGAGVKWAPAVEPKIPGNGNIAALDRAGNRVLMDVSCPIKPNVHVESRKAFSIWDVRSGKCQLVSAAIPLITGQRYLASSDSLDRFAVSGGSEIWVAERETSGTWRTTRLPVRGDADFSWVTERGSIGGYAEGLSMAPGGAALLALTSCSFVNQSRVKVFGLVSGQATIALPAVPGCVTLGAADFVTERYVVTATTTASSWHLRVFDVLTGQLLVSQDFPGTETIRSFAAHHGSRAFAITFLSGDSTDDGRQAVVRVFKID